MINWQEEQRMLPAKTGEAAGQGAGRPEGPRSRQADGTPEEADAARVFRRAGEVKAAFMNGMRAPAGLTLCIRGRIGSQERADEREKGPGVWKRGVYEF